MGGKVRSGAPENADYLEGGRSKLRCRRARPGRPQGCCTRASARSGHARFQPQRPPDDASAGALRSICEIVAQGGIAEIVGALRPIAKQCRIDVTFLAVRQRTRTQLHIVVIGPRRSATVAAASGSKADAAY
jgi:hypothetical protein